ncbi:MAG: thiol reductant ABC exporter subunit CydD [Lautropia sp.]|nr:thiol reductant ABC exporter subunit CydD [Lautropia sp.]
MKTDENPANDAELAAAAQWLRAQGRGAPVWLAIALPVLSGLLLLPQVFALARALHLLVIEDQPLSAVSNWLLLAAMLLLVRAVLAWAAEVRAQHVAEQVKCCLRDALMQRLVSSGVSWTRSRASGALADALVTQVELLEGYFARYLPAMVSAGFLPLVFCAVLAVFDWVAALILFCTLPVIPLFMALVGWGAETASRRHATALTRLSGLFADRVSGLVTLKLHGRAGAEAMRVAAASEELRVRSMKVLRIAFLSSAVLEFFAALGVAAMALYFGLGFLGFLRFGPESSLEVALFCLVMAPETYLPLRQMAATYHDRAHARAAVAEIAQLFDGLPERDGTAVVPESAAAPVAPAKGVRQEPSEGFRMDDLRIAIPGRATLRMAEGALRPGEWVALAGRSGSGKSTLLETLAGLRPFEGGLHWEGRALQHLPQAQLRQHVLLISQRPWLAPGSIADNLRLIAPDADDAMLMQALAAVGLDAWVRTLPQGLDTPLGMRGHGASGGQAQRLALARLFLTDVPVLLLDEPTAHLDARSRASLLQALSRFAHGRSVLLASHDPVALAWAHRRWQIDEHGQVWT